jgi:multidrug resistance efflux pump
VAEVAAARVTFELAEKNLRRAEKLIESGDVSRSFYDEQRARRDQLKEQYEVALAQARQNFAGSTWRARTSRTRRRSWRSRERVFRTRHSGADRWLCV